MARADLTVGSAISLSDSISAVSSAYEKKTGIKVRHTFAGTNVIARQIEAGAPIDIFISADTATAAALEKKQLIGKSIPIARNQLVVVVPEDSTLKLFTPENLKTIGKIAIADPSSVPAGIYARIWLAKENLWQKLQPNLIPLQNVRAALIAAETSNTNAAITYQTDAISSKKVKVAYLVSEENTGRITYPAALVTASKDKISAQAFLDFLTTPQAQEILKSHGFLPPQAQP